MKTQLHKGMGWLGRQSKLLGAVTVAVIIGGATTAAVLAAVPDNSGVIHSCYKTGFLDSFKIIDTPSQSCAAGQTELDWNKQGVPGPQGPQGPTGPTGNTKNISFYTKSTVVAMNVGDTSASATVACDSFDDLALGGGYQFNASPPESPTPYPPTHISTEINGNGSATYSGQSPNYKYLWSVGLRFDPWSPVATLGTHFVVTSQCEHTSL